MVHSSKTGSDTPLSSYAHYVIDFSGNSATGWQLLQQCARPQASEVSNNDNLA
jgi:hypothetical protein